MDDLGDNQFADFECLGHIYNIIHEDINFHKPIEIKFDYEPQDGVDPDKVFIGRYSNGNWSKLDTYYDGDNNQLAATTPGLSLFGWFFGDEAEIAVMNTNPSPYTGFTSYDVSSFENDLEVNLIVSDDGNTINSARIGVRIGGGLINDFIQGVTNLLGVASGYNLLFLPFAETNETSYAILEMESIDGGYHFVFEKEDLGELFTGYCYFDYLEFNCEIMDNDGDVLDSKIKRVFFDNDAYPIVNLIEPSETASIQPILTFQVDGNGGIEIFNYEKYKIVIDDSNNPFEAWFKTYQFAGNIDNSSQYSHTIDEELTPGEMYYWQVRISKNNSFDEDNSEVICSEIFCFTVQENQPPNEPFNPSPSNNTTNQDINTILSWTCSDPDGDNLTYDVYFGTDSSPDSGELVNESQSITSFTPSNMQYETTYYWQIIASDEENETASAIWSFTTQQEPVNLPPTVNISNPQNNFQTSETSILVSGTASDSDGSVSQVQLRVNNGNWGNATGTSNWSKTVSIINGNNTIEVKAKDNEGEWSNIESINITCDTSSNNPTLIITEPINNSTLNYNMITIRGTASDPNGSILEVQVKVNNGSWSVANGTTDWYIIKSIQDGANIIYAKAKDNENNWSEEVTINVCYSPDENTAPLVTISSPNNEQEFEVGENILFTGSAVDEEDGTISGNSLSWTSSIDGYLGSGTNLELNNLGLGSHLITLVAEDSEGLTGSASINISVVAVNDAENPEIVIISPDPNETVSGNVTLEVQATDNIGVTQVVFEVMRNGVGYEEVGVDTTPDENNHFSIEFGTSGFENGEYNIHATAYDLAGNSELAGWIIIFENNGNGTVTDIDGNVYQTIIIGNQEWMIENLKVTHYNNGDQIPTGHSNNDWANLSTGAYCVYNDDQSNAETYGCLYNWYSVDDSRLLAPEGWRIPTDEEIMEMEMALGMSESEANSEGWRGTNEGSKIAGRADLWSNGDLVNDSQFGSSGFSFLPGGCRGSYGNYGNIGGYGYFWSSSSHDVYDAAWRRDLYYSSAEVYRSIGSKEFGFSVRCVRDRD